MHSDLRAFTARPARLVVHQEVCDSGRLSRPEERKMNTLWKKPPVNVLAVVIVLGLLVLVSNMLADWKLNKKLTPKLNPRSKPPSRPPPSGPCSCPARSTLLRDHLPKDEFEDIVRRRDKEFKEYKTRRDSVLNELLYAAPNSPLQYPIQGFTVRPLTPTLIPGLRLFAEERSSYKVSLKVSVGVLTAEVSGETATVTGNGKDELTISSSSLVTLNDLLTKVSYQSTVYHINTGDLATFRFEHHEAVFPVAIKQPPLPVLWDMGTDINSQVSVAIKAFLRYPKVRTLVDSIRRFYPKIPIIIADDSIEKESIAGENIEHYLMPPAKGFFAGRNLAVSQVSTKYFLWVDDDFLFTEKTKIEKFVEVMEANPELDVVGGSVKGNRFYFSLVYEEGNETEGGCLRRKSGGKFHPLPGYPHCSLAHGVVNFFLARTQSVLKVGFDPKLRRVAHSEFFMDGLGSLMVASCNDASSMYVDHQPSKGNPALYGKFRRPGNNDTAFKKRLHFFKNNLKCILYA